MLDKVFRPCESIVIERVGSPRIDCVENFRIFVVFLNISAVAWFVESRRISSSFSRVLKTQFKVKQWNFRELSGSKPRLTVAVDHDGRPATRSTDRIEKK